MEPFVPLLVVLVALAAATALLGQVRRTHRDRYLAFAQEHGWTYTARDDSLHRRFSGEPFGRGTGQRTTNVLRGHYAGHEAVVFDYRFVVRAGDGQSAQTARFTVCALRLPAPLPRLQLTGETALTRLAGTLHPQDLALESEDFNRRYRISTADRRFASDVLHPRTMEHLLAAAPANLRIDGADALVWARGTTRLDEVPDRLAALAGVVDAIPAYVWADQCRDPA